MEEIDFNITVVGLGLIGGSYAMALKELNPKNIWGIDRDEATLNYAEKQGIINKGYVDPKEPLSNSDIVIVCLYPSSIVEFIKDNINNFKEGVIITDTAGIKESLIDEINSFLPESIDFIGGHPMAGKECKGIYNATKEIFIGANYIITPIEKNKLNSILLIENIAKSIGCKRVVRVTPKEHDEIIAYTSHLPHVIASALINCNAKEDTKFFVGGSFNDATRVAKINTDLWLELMLKNKKNLINKIDMFECAINKIKNAIESEEKEELKNILNNGSIEKGLLEDNDFY